MGVVRDSAMQTFSPACDLSSRAMVWAVLRDGINHIHNGQIMVLPAHRIAAIYASKFH